jgi:hypothetical protein
MVLALPAEGGCQCGENRYRIIGEPVWLAVCHCNDCKHQSGSAFGMSLRVRKADLEIIRGESRSWTTTSDSGNPKICYFCGTCGNRLWHEPAQSGFVHIKPGTLDDRSQLGAAVWGMDQTEGWLANHRRTRATFETHFSVTSPGR